MAITRQSKVCLIPFQVQLTRLSEKQIEKYSHSYASKPAATIPRPSRLSPIVTRSLTRSKQPQHKKRLISGHPSKLNVPTYSFKYADIFYSNTAAVFTLNVEPEGAPSLCILQQIEGP